MKRCAALALLLGAGATLAAPPALGTYAASLCVAPITEPERVPNCGPADVVWARRGRARVQVNDIAYRLTLYSRQLDVLLMHGAMQIDEFKAPFEWDGSTLKFSDADKGLRYEVRIGERRLESAPR